MAVAHALLKLGAEELVVFDIEQRRSEHLAHTLSARWGTRIETPLAPDAAIGQANGIVNTTPVGMAKYPGLPIRVELLTAQHWVSEIIYFPSDTELVRQALALGCRTLKGTGMAVGQAVRSFELFAGVTADRAAMSAHFLAAA